MKNDLTVFCIFQKQPNKTCGSGDGQVLLLPVCINLTSVAREDFLAEMGHESRIPKYKFSDRMTDEGRCTH